MKQPLQCLVYLSKTVLIYQDSEVPQTTQRPHFSEDSVATVGTSSDNSWKDNLTNKKSLKLDSNAENSKQNPPVAMETAGHNEENNTSSNKRKWNFVYSNGRYNDFYSPLMNNNY